MVVTIMRGEFLEIARKAGLKFSEVGDSIVFLRVGKICIPVPAEVEIETDEGSPLLYQEPRVQSPDELILESMSSDKDMETHWDLVRTELLEFQKAFQEHQRKKAQVSFNFMQEA